MKNYFLMSQTALDLLFVNNIPSKDYLYYVEECPVCNSKRQKKLFQQWHFNYFRCKNCDFIYSNPRLTSFGACKWYNSDYYKAAMKTEHYLAEFKNPYFSVSLNQLFSNFIKIFKYFDFPKYYSIIDIGCGSGSVLFYLKKELGYNNIRGLDLNESNIKFAKRVRNIEIENKDIYELKTDDKFDIVITTENIEHVSDPLAYIKLVKKLCKPNGYVFLTTPHNDRKATFLMGLFGDHFCAPNHQNYFNLQNLGLLLKKAGFELRKEWLDNSNSFNLYTFIKRFFVFQDQITAYPPVKATLRPIWKWKKTPCVILNAYSESNFENATRKYDFKKRMQKRMKSLFADLLPLKFTTHQIVVARNVQN